MENEIAEKTPHNPWRLIEPYLYKNMDSGRYYSRLGRQGVFCALKTDRISTARLRLADRLHEFKKSSHLRAAASNGDVNMGQVIDLFLQSTTDDAELRESTKKDRKISVQRLAATWPELELLKPRDVTISRIAAWASRASKMAAKTPPGASIRNKPYTIRSLQKAANALRSILLYSVKIDALNAAPPVQVFTGGKAKRPTLPSRTHLKALLYEIQYLRNAEVIKAAKACGAETEGKTQEEVATGLGISLATYKRHRNGTTVGNGKDSADFAKLLIFTGMRVDEARNLKWGDINLEKGQITVHGTKTSSSYRTIPMIPELKAHLESLGGEHHPTGHVSKVKNINRALASACKRLSIPKLTHHSLRHLFATIAIESRVDIPTVSSWLGHADGGSLAMRVYGHLRDEHSQAEAQKVFALK